MNTLVEDALLEDEGGDVEAHLTCKSLVGGKLAFQPFYHEIERSESGWSAEGDSEGEGIRGDGRGGDKGMLIQDNPEERNRNDSLESSDDTTASASIIDDIDGENEQLQPPQSVSLGPALGTGQSRQNSGRKSEKTTDCVLSHVIHRGNERTSKSSPTSANSSPTCAKSSPTRLNFGMVLLPDSPVPEPLSFDLVEARIFREGD